MYTRKLMSNSSLSFEFVELIVPASFLMFLLNLEFD